MSSEPTPVIIQSPNPVPVMVTNGAPPSPVPVDSSVKLTLPPTTTEEQDLVTSRQSHINRVWEYTQAFIAIFVVVASTSSAVWASMNGKDVSAFLAFICGSVVGSYFSRTNHQAIGGMGPKPDQRYIGR